MEGHGDGVPVPQGKLGRRNLGEGQGPLFQPRANRGKQGKFSWSAREG